LAEATPVADSDSFSAPTSSRNNEEKVLRLEAQLELERQRVANLEQKNQQPGGPPVPSTTTWKSSYVALGIVLVVVLLLLLLVVVVVAVVIALVNDSGSRIPMDFLPRNESILTYINSITRSNQTLSYPPTNSTGSTTEERAVQWLIEDDLNTTADDWDALRQRYALSTLWFIIPAPAGAFGTDDDRNFTNTWTTDLDECDWLGVTCDDNGRVMALFLQQVNVQGRIPDDLGLLTAMTSLQLLGNQLTGTIPSSLTNMTNLVYLALSTNLLAGTIPLFLGTFTNLTTLHLHTNELSGTIPSSLATLTGLVELRLNDNNLTGTIPSSLVALTALTGLWLHTNQLNGTVPLCGLNQTFELLVTNCAKVSCPCCTHCCPTASEDGTIPVYDVC
jgi:hypothetical protein